MRAQRQVVIKNTKVLRHHFAQPSLLPIGINRPHIHKSMSHTRRRDDCQLANSEAEGISPLIPSDIDILICQGDDGRTSFELGVLNPLLKEFYELFGHELTSFRIERSAR